MTIESSANADPLNRPALGIFLRILSGALFAAMAVFVKAVSVDVPVGQIVFFRSAFALIPLVVFLWIRGEFPGGLATKRPLDHLLRSALGTAAMFASFASIARLPLAEATLLGYLSPVFTAIAGVIILSERATVWRAAGVLLGTVGVVALVWPELGQTAADETRLIGYGFGLLMGLLTAFALIMVRSLSRTESPGAIAFYFVVASMAGGIATLPFGWATPSLNQLLYLVGAGIFGGFAHICMTLAFRYTEASRLAPFEYLAIVWPILADLILFGEPLTHPFLLALPLVLSGAAVAALEARRRA
ncbi:DMT family transporter [Peteryoungia ipomoeae]|uniref:DMT family transporter n=1 Tax=Peteryoungia ipomoeae TaxID=1210932 RepID=A0A4S8NZG7_9HYPH|nr:DMT family transporter [Peteryoungia ipomoeae]THV20549.1 DMT family transporter [Peteryoungia ipomoeae]